MAAYETARGIALKPDGAMRTSPPHPAMGATQEQEQDDEKAVPVDRDGMAKA